MKETLKRLRQNLLMADRHKIMSECIDEKLNKSLNSYYDYLVRRYDYLLTRSATRTLNNILKEQERREKEQKRLSRLAKKEAKQASQPDNQGDTNETNK